MPKRPDDERMCIPELIRAKEEIERLKGFLAESNSLLRWFEETDNCKPPCDLVGQVREYMGRLRTLIG